MENQEKIIWTDELSIGNTGIDSDHKKLLDILNSLVELANLGGEYKKFAKILSRMTDYSLIHFRREEEYLEKFSYPEFKEHKKYHKEYKYKIAMFNTDFYVKNKQDMQKVILFLNNWWVDHILNVDKKYEEFKNKIQSEVVY